jgi:hypothetical protein
MKERVEAEVAKLDMDNEEKQLVFDMLVHYFLNTPWATTVYAPVNAMKNKLAGADCDFDATMCDMSDLKWTLVNARLEEQKANPGYMGDCTVVNYKGHLKRNMKKSNVSNEDKLK